MENLDGFINHKTCITCDDGLRQYIPLVQGRLDIREAYLESVEELEQEVVPRCLPINDCTFVLRVRESGPF